MSSSIAIKFDISAYGLNEMGKAGTDLRIAISNHHYAIASNLLEESRRGLANVEEVRVEELHSGKTVAKANSMRGFFEFIPFVGVSTADRCKLLATCAKTIEKFEAGIDHFRIQGIRLITLAAEQIRDVGQQRDEKARIIVNLEAQLAAKTTQLTIEINEKTNLARNRDHLQSSVQEKAALIQAKDSELAQRNLELEQVKDVLIKKTEEHQLLLRKQNEITDLLSKSNEESAKKNAIIRELNHKLDKEKTTKNHLTIALISILALTSINMISSKFF